MSREYAGWWCTLCNREYPSERARRFRKVGNIPECPRCHNLMVKISRKPGDMWMSGNGRYY